MELKVANIASAPGVTEESGPETILDWGLKRFARRNMVTTTAFGMEGCALIDMVAKRAANFTVIYVDTGFFFEQTLELRDRMVERYPHLSFVKVETQLTPQAQAKQYGDKLWERNPDFCCRIRKVEPLAAAMEDVDVWLTGLRRSQSASRNNLQVVEWSWQYEVVKINPLANWERKDVWEYIQKHNVPYNPLHHEGYPSVGCTHCTQHVAGASITDYSRAGRWNGQAKSECGLHGYGI